MIFQKEITLPSFPGEVISFNKSASHFQLAVVKTHSGITRRMDGMGSGPMSLPFLTLWRVLSIRKSKLNPRRKYDKSAHLFCWCPIPTNKVMISHLPPKPLVMTDCWTYFGWKSQICSIKLSFSSTHC